MEVEDALEGELDDHLGYARHDPGKPRWRQFPQQAPGQDRLTEARPTVISVLRDRDS
jgi:transposase-like protein